MTRKGHLKSGSKKYNFPWPWEGKDSHPRSSTAKAGASNNSEDTCAQQALGPAKQQGRKSFLDDATDAFSAFSKVQEIELAANKLVLKLLDKSSVLDPGRRRRVEGVIESRLLAPVMEASLIKFIEISVVLLCCAKNVLE